MRSLFVLPPTSPCSKWLALIGGKRSDSPGDMEKAEKEAGETRQNSLALLLAYTMLYFFRPQALLVQDVLVGVIGAIQVRWVAAVLAVGQYVLVRRGCCGKAVGSALVGLACLVLQRPDLCSFQPALQPPCRSCSALVECMCEPNCGGKQALLLVGPPTFCRAACQKRCCCACGTCCASSCTASS